MHARSRFSRARRRVAAGFVGALVAVPLAPVGGTPAGGAVTASPDVGAATHTAVGLRLVGRNDLGGRGLNGDLAVVGTTVAVGSGVVVDTGYHTERYNPIPCHTGLAVKIVDASDPANPRVVSTIPQPNGVASIDVDALKVSTPSFTGDLLAVALDDGPSHQGPTACQPTTAINPRGVAYYDITTPALPRFLGRYEADVAQAPAEAPPCGQSTTATNRCAVGQHSVDLVQRADGRVLSVSTEVLAGHPVVNQINGDLRIVDVTNPGAPTLLGAWPPLGQRFDPFGPNGCRRFGNSHSATVDESGTRALLTYMDEGLFHLDISNPAAVRLLGRFDYPTTREVEGNAAYVDIGEAGGRPIAVLSEEDWVAPATSLRVDAPASIAGSKFACENMSFLFDLDNNAQLYRRPNAQVGAEIVYVGRGCPAGGANPPDPYLANPAGRIVMVDAAKIAATQPNIPDTTVGCNFVARTLRAQAAGAVGLVYAHRVIPPFQNSPFTISFAGNGIGPEIPGIAVDEPDGNALRSTLCPGIDAGGNCVGGTPVTGAMLDRPGEWGGVRVLDMSNPAAPTPLSVYRTARAQAFPPPDLGVYSAGHVEVRGSLAYTAWYADGLRVLDLSNPALPREIASFVPADTPDPTGTFPAKAHVTGVETLPGHVVISDQNSGLYILELGGGYWTAAADGGVFAFGSSDFHGSMGGARLNRPVVGMAPTPTGKGYWLVASDAGIFSFGDARFFGSTGALGLNRPIVGMTPTPSGRGYWLVASDGGVFAFGDARFFGSTGAIRLNSPVVGMASTPSGRGYWLVAADGGIFAFGDAVFRGSTGAIRLNRPVVGMAATATGNGYHLVASDGGIFAFGDAVFRGSTGGTRLNSPVVGMRAAPSGRGYWLVAADGGVFAFGDAPFLGSTGAIRLNSPVVGMGAFPT